jgi:23S rRNA (guanine745-N1)-methyltransferase
VSGTTRSSARGFPAAAMPLLRCPFCRMSFSVAENGALRCSRGHSFDVARQGYVNLLPGDARRGTADTADMVAARETFLATGHFSGLREFVCRAAEKAVRQSAVEQTVDVAAAFASVGADGGGARWRRIERRSVRRRGAERWDTGRRDARPRGAERWGAWSRLHRGGRRGYRILPDGSAGSLSRPSRLGARHLQVRGAPRGARARARRGGSATCGTCSVADVCADLVLDVFAPQPTGVQAILRPRGILIVVTPARPSRGACVAAGAADRR